MHKNDAPKALLIHVNPKVLHTYSGYVHPSGMDVPNQRIVLFSKSIDFIGNVNVSTHKMATIFLIMNMVAIFLINLK